MMNNIKKILFLFISILMFVSCDTDFNNVTNNLNSNSSEIKQREFVFKGHKYIEFIDAVRYGISIVHDPDCLINDIDSINSLTNNK